MASYPPTRGVPWRPGPDPTFDEAQNTHQELTFLYECACIWMSTCMYEWVKSTCVCDVCVVCAYLCSWVKSACQSHPNYEWLYTNWVCWLFPTQYYYLCAIQQKSQPSISPSSMLTLRKRSDPFKALVISSFSLSVAAVREFYSKLSVPMRTFQTCCIQFMKKQPTQVIIHRHSLKR